MLDDSQRSLAVCGVPVNLCESSRLPIHVRGLWATRWGLWAKPHGSPQARGATIGGTQVHSVRLPGYVLAVEALFGLPHERLTIRHEAGKIAAPYVHGTLLAVRRVMNTTGLIRGLDRLLFDS